MQRTPPAASTTQQLCVTRSTPTAFDASWPSASTLACKGFAAWAAYHHSRSHHTNNRKSSLVRCGETQTERCSPPGGAAAAPAHAVFGFGSEAGRPPKGPEPRSDRGKGRRVISVPPLAAVRLACFKDALSAVAVWLPHDLSGILIVSLADTCGILSSQLAYPDGTGARC